MILSCAVSTICTAGYLFKLCVITHDVDESDCVNTKFLSEIAPADEMISAVIFRETSITSIDVVEF